MPQRIRSDGPAEVEGKLALAGGGGGAIADASPDWLGLDKAACGSVSLLPFQAP